MMSTSEVPKAPVGPFAPTFPPTTTGPYSSFYNGGMWGPGPAPGPAPAPFGMPSTTFRPYMLLDVNTPEVETPPPIVTDLSMMAPMGSSMMQMPYAPSQAMQLPVTAMPDWAAPPMPVTAMPDWAAPPMSFLQESAGDAAGGIYSEEPIPGCGCQCTQEELAMKEANDNALKMAEFPEEGEPVPWGHVEESEVKAPKFHMPSSERHA